MSTDSFIKEKYGKHQTFKVPAGYFEGLSSQIMAHTDNRPALKLYGLWGKYKKSLLLAACLCAFAVSTAIYVHSAYDAEGNRGPRAAFRDCLTTIQWRALPITRCSTMMIYTHWCQIIKLKSLEKILNHYYIVGVVCVSFVFAGQQEVRSSSV